MSTMAATFGPLLNPDKRPLPAGWTQHYDPDRQLWIYLDMNVLPPRATITHPAGPPGTPARRIEAHGRATAAVPLTTRYQNTEQTHRDRMNQTLAQQLYSSALPAIEKAGTDEFGMRVEYDTDEIVPSYDSIEAMSIPFTSTVPPPSNATTKPARRPLPKTPGSSAAMSHPLPRHPDPTIAEEAFEGPSPVRPTNGALGLHVDHPVKLADTLQKAVPRQEPWKSDPRGKPPSYSTATSSPAVRQGAPSLDIPSMVKNCHSMAKPLSATTSIRPLAPQEEPCVKTPDTNHQTAELSTSFSPLSLSSDDITISHLPPVSLASSVASRPSHGPSAGQMSAPSTPEPGHTSLTPNRRVPHSTSEIITLVNRYVKPPGISQDPSLFDATTLYSNTQQTVASSPASQRSPSPVSTRPSSPIPSQRPNQFRFPQIPSSSTVSIAAPTDVQSHPIHNDPDLVETTTFTSNQPSQKKPEKFRKLRKFSFGFNKLASIGNNGLKGVFGRARVSNLDLLADPSSAFAAPNASEIDPEVGDNIDMIQPQQTNNTLRPASSQSQTGDQDTQISLSYTSPGPLSLLSMHNSGHGSSLRVSEDFDRIFAQASLPTQKPKPTLKNQNSLPSFAHSPSSQPSFQRRPLTILEPPHSGHL